MNRPMNDQAAKLFDKLTHDLPFADLWDQIGAVKMHEMECDDGTGLLKVIAGGDGDMHAFIEEGPRAKELHHFGPPGFRARTFGGGGRHERVRRALMLLALAIKADEGR